MMDILERLFKKKQNSESLRGKKTLQDIRIATCALMIEMSKIDGRFSASEEEKILSILKTNYGLSGEEAALLLDASNEELEKSIDLWRFARLINESYTLEEKQRIMEMVWEIAYTDGILDKHEDYLLHKLAKLLRLSHKQLIDAKLKVKHAVTDGGENR